MAEIYLCVHCGERMKGKKRYCSYCDTAAKRKVIDDENKNITEENKVKIPHLLGYGR